MELTNDDVADILALLDSLPYDSLEVETSRFRLTLRRAAGGGWTEESQLLAEPTVVTGPPERTAPPTAAPLGWPKVPGGPARTSATAEASAASASGSSAATRAGAGAPPAGGGPGATASTSGSGAAAGTGSSGTTGGAGGSDAAPGVGAALGPDGSGSSAGADDLDGSGAAAGAGGLAVVSAPLPGTFYRAPRPGADPFVQVGDAVAADTVVAIVETMKLMNSVPAGTAGRVSRICADNGEFAPAGATLMLIEPDA